MLQHERTTRVKVLLKVWTCLLCWETFLTSKVDFQPSMSHQQLRSLDFLHKAFRILHSNPYPAIQICSHSAYLIVYRLQPDVTIENFVVSLGLPRIPKRIKTRKIKFIEACNRSDRKTLTITFTPRLHARAFCRREKLLSEKRWRARLKTSGLCLILCLADHNTQCCLSAVFFRGAESHATRRKEIRIKTVNMKQYLIRFMSMKCRFSYRRRCFSSRHEWDRIVVINFNQLRISHRLLKSWFEN